MLKGFSGDKTQLGSAEKFLLAVVSIPGYVNKFHYVPALIEEYSINKTILSVVFLLNLGYAPFVRKRCISGEKQVPYHLVDKNQGFFPP